MLLKILIIKKKNCRKHRRSNYIKPKSLEGDWDLNSFDRLDDVSEKIISQNIKK